MKTILFSIVLIGLTFCASAQLVTNQPARLKTKIVCGQHRLHQGGFGTAINAAPESTYLGNGGSDREISPGFEHELKWTFTGRSQGKDVYHFTFTRMTEAGSTNQTTTSKEVQFDGKQVIVFEDELHTVVMESPSAEDLKKAQGH
jgi:hypothetical protein